MWPFKCKHPASALFPKKDHTETPSKEYPEYFTEVTFYAYCIRCGEPVTLSYAKMIGGVDGFLERGMERIKQQNNSTISVASNR